MELVCNSTCDQRGGPDIKKDISVRGFAPFMLKSPSKRCWPCPLPLSGRPLCGLGLPLALLLAFPGWALLDGRGSFLQILHLSSVGPAFLALSGWSWPGWRCWPCILALSGWSWPGWARPWRFLWASLAGSCWMGVVFPNCCP